MKVFFVGSIYNLSFPDNVSQTLHLPEGLIISNKFCDFQNSCPDFKKLESSIGSNQMYFLKNSKALIWSEIDTSLITKENIGDENVRDVINSLQEAFLATASGIVESLWFLCKCCCYIDNVVGQLVNGVDVVFQVMNRFITNADGQRSNLIMTQSDIQVWFSFLVTYHEFLMKIGLVRTDPGPKNNKKNKVTRLERALILLREARYAPGLDLKLANYVVVLECLFSNDNSEINHRIAERVACYTEPDPHKRYEVFKFVKECYNVRSIYVHGKVMSKNNVDLARMSVKIDTTLRHIFAKIISKDIDKFLLGKNDKDPKKDFETNMINLVFGIPL